MLNVTKLIKLFVGYLIKAILHLQFFSLNLGWLMNGHQFLDLLPSIGLRP
jgi:hypothetical protein